MPAAVVGARSATGLARLFRRCGYETRTEYYVNDRGTQMELFGRSLLARLRGEPVPEGGYQGDYVTEWSTELAAEMTDDSDVDKAASWGCERALRDVRESLEAMNVSFDHWQSEAELVASGAMERAVERLREGGWRYEQDGAEWLRTSEFGDDKDRVLYRSDGEPTYFVPDIAYHDAKFDLRRFGRCSVRARRHPRVRAIPAMRTSASSSTCSAPIIMATCRASPQPCRCSVIPPSPMRPSSART